MTANVKGRGIRVEVAATYGSPIAINGVSNANPGVVSETGHGLTAGQVGYFSGVSGMVQLEDQAIRVAGVTTDTFTLQGLDTTNYSAFVSGNLTMAATWATLGEATSYSIPDASSEDLDATTLLDVIDVVEAGNLAAQPLNVSVLSKETLTAAMTLIEAAARAGTKMLVRITLQQGGVRVYYGTPSAPGEDVQAKQLGKGSLSFKGRGFLLKLAA
ncbi:MAG: phage tail tube protein [Pseudomonadota bacterium]